MTKPQALDLLMLLSALESWSFSTGKPLPDGWKLVPIEPTQEMINHVIDERLDALVAGEDHTFIDIYKAMLAAAPEAKP